MTASLSTFFPIADGDRNSDVERERDRQGETDREREREREREGGYGCSRVLPSQDEWTHLTSVNGERGLFVT